MTSIGLEAPKYPSYATDHCVTATLVTTPSEARHARKDTQTHTHTHAAQVVNEIPLKNVKHSFSNPSNLLSARDCSHLLGCMAINLY